MTGQSRQAPLLRKPTLADFRRCLALGLEDFLAAPLIDLFFASFFVVAGLAMAAITYQTGQTFWLVLAVLGFPLVGTLACVGFYETSRRRQDGVALSLPEIAAYVWALRRGQLPWLATIIIVVFLFWFFLGHMIFALFLGLSPMTNISTSLNVFLSYEGLAMIGFGTTVGSIFAMLVFSISVYGIPTLIDRDIDFMTSLLRSISAVASNPIPHLMWGVFLSLTILLSMLPLFLGLLMTMPILGHASWHLYKLVSS